MKRQLAAGLVVCALAVTLGFAVLYALPVYAVVHSRHLVSSQPETWVVPIPLPNAPIERSEGTTFSRYGYQFDVPWTQLRREQNGKSMTILSFADGPVVAVYDPAQQVDELEVMREADKRPGLTVSELFGADATKSHYAFRSRILYMTPNDLRLSWSRREMAARSALILLKPMYMGLTKSRIYSFRTNWLRGFQAGDSQVDKVTTVDAFDTRDREIKLWVGSNEATKKPSQAEINRIIYSLHPLE